MNSQSGWDIGVRSTLSGDEPHPLTMIECQTCHYLGFSHLVYSELEALLCDGSISRHCHGCGQRTMWRRVDIHPGVNSLKERKKGCSDDPGGNDKEGDPALTAEIRN